MADLKEPKFNQETKTIQRKYPLRNRGEIFSEILWSRLRVFVCESRVYVTISSQCRKSGA